MKKVGVWHLSETKFTKDQGKVFSAFACCGGSTMGYKLSGFDVIGMNEIDPKIAKIYQANHNPKYSFVCSIRNMINIDLPDDLYNLDILDGSPPCTTFSQSGKREESWSVVKKFSEGQAVQRLDDLFFSFIELANKLKPKIIVAENVKGIIRGKAKGYVKEIIKKLEKIGYTTQIFLLNGANMGLPQARERVFFISRRNDLDLKQITLKFDEPFISVEKAFGWLENFSNDKSNTRLPKSVSKYYYKCTPGSCFKKVHPKGYFFNYMKLHKKQPSFTITGNDTIVHFNQCRTLTKNETAVVSSFPLDFNFLNASDTKAKWAMGMSVPPYMMNRISNEIKKQWGHVFDG